MGNADMIGQLKPPGMRWRVSLTVTALLPGGLAS